MTNLKQTRIGDVKFNIYLSSVSVRLCQSVAISCAYRRHPRHVVNMLRLEDLFLMEAAKGSVLSMIVWPRIRILNHDFQVSDGGWGKGVTMSRKRARRARRRLRSLPQCAQVHSSHSVRYIKIQTPFKEVSEHS